MAVTASPVSKPSSSNRKGKIKRSERKKEDKRRKPTDSGRNLPAKRTKAPGVRLVHGRIYDSENGKTCHQCRQKTMDFVASCKNQKSDKPCTINFCHKCLLNRYGEKAEEMAVLEEWSCPKCRGICNCSFCMKKRGHRPTGILVHTAKATGFASVSELLHINGPENFGVEDVRPKKAATSNNEPAVVSPTKLGKENSFSGNSNYNLRTLSLPSSPEEKKPKKIKREGFNGMQDGNQETNISNERLKKTQDGKQKDEFLLKTTNRKPLISNRIFKKEAKRSEKIEAVREKKKKLKTEVCKGVKSNMIRCEKGKEQRDFSHWKGAEVLDGQGLDEDEAKPSTVVESCKVQTDDGKLQSKDLEPNIPLPQGRGLATIAGIDLLPEDVGHALQFLEFCAAFWEVLELKKGEPEYILRELVRGGRARQGKVSLVVRFHIQLLTVIQKDLGEESPEITPKHGKHSWLHALHDCASRSQCVLKKLKLDGFGKEADDYGSLDYSKKLRLLTFLCDEALGTVKMRSWIDNQNSKFVEELKEAKERVMAAKHEERELKQKMKDEIANAIIAKNGAPLSISEHEAVVSQIKAEAALAHAKLLESKDMVPNDKQRSDAVRTEPIISDASGCTYWRLKGDSECSNVLLQDLGTWDAVEMGEKWFTFDDKQEKEIAKHIQSLRKRRLSSHRTTDALLPSKVSEED